MAPTGRITITLVTPHDLSCVTAMIYNIFPMTNSLVHNKVPYKIQISVQFAVDSLCFQ